MLANKLQDVNDTSESTDPYWVRYSWNWLLDRWFETYT